MSGIRCPMCDNDIYDCECEDRYGKAAPSSCTSALPCSVPCPHQHPETWKCKFDGLMKPDGMCPPHTFEHRPVKLRRDGFYSSIRCMVAPNAGLHRTSEAQHNERG